ncbi:ABC transporter ATP-binding protein [Salipaludibacillus agaradhaerens]|uniref:ABC transporter ATP-binding protein n=1 Tax=Salipaludibacillus agaradhaerens TaxID=76935 RepID=A0A9Q4B078_SALAG|nr:ABC transporter ATP-binding protein [Salipaludibacillus agaradhaerens]MCR6095976.1 ABC transporter ATP-binding protein [Salipaludibacillus agaradhaerens]MCR6114465.1 ABC transporter ATP-binding protein [Salipaludibacillus agaradhaerens]
MDTFKRLKQFYWPYKRYFFLSIILLLFVSAFTVVYPIILQITIDDIVLEGNYQLVPYVAIGFFLITLLKSIAVYYHQFLGDLFGIQSVYELRNALYKKLQFLPFRYYDNARTGDLMSRLTADVEAFRFFLSFGFAQLINLAMLVGLSMGIMFYYSPLLAVVTLAALPFLIITVYRFDQKVHPAFSNIRKSLADMTTKAQENISGMTTVKSLSKENFEMGRFDEKNADYKNQFINTSNIWAKYFPFMELIGQICVVVLLAYGGWLVINGGIQPGVLVAFFSLIWYIIGPLMNLGFIINTFSQSKASGERLLQVLDEREDIFDKPEAIEKHSLKGHVVFEEVSHRYGKEEDLALKEVSFEALPGQTIGLIGATGSGKTSITQLIARFYEPDRGCITIDGLPISNYTLKTLRKNIGVVLQESFLFSSSVKDNISYGNPSATMAEIIDAAKRADAHEFIETLPQGYDTVLGERGGGLSGGQKQRIAIARAICVNPSILILDDATSAVDMETEAKIQRAFREVMKGRTTFIIAHRISSLMHADDILVLDEGRIVERGTHEQLLQITDGNYRRIYDIQFRDRKQFLDEAK